MFRKNISSNEKRGRNSRVYTYDRDIICSPKSFLGKDDLFKIPCQASVRDNLASNCLICKIRLHSDMTE